MNREFQGTAGPWRVTGVDLPECFQVENEEGEFVAQCVNGRGFASLDGVNNATLIAAAPDMLKALFEAADEVEELRRYANNHGGMIDNERCDYARAAITKALG